MLITAYGKQGDFRKAERVLGYMHRKGYPPHVGSYTALMEAYGRGGQYNKAEAIFRRMQSSGPEPSAVTYQIILKAFVEVTDPGHFHFLCSDRMQSSGPETICCNVSDSINYMHEVVCQLHL